MTDDMPEALDEVPVETDDIAEQVPASPGAIKSTLVDGIEDGSLALLAGGSVLLATARSIVRGRLRAILQAVLGVALVRFGLRQRRAAGETVGERVLGGDVFGGGDEDSTVGESSDESEKETSDEAHTAVHDGSSLEPEFDERTGDESNDSGTEVEASTDVTFDDDEPRSKPDLDAEAEDPRRNTDDDEVEIDVSEAAFADEASEATGPDPEQSQPTRTEETEPEPDSEIEEDASHVRVDPSEDGSNVDDEDESDVEDELDVDAEGEPDAEDEDESNADEDR